MRLEHYLSAASFRAKILALTRAAVAGLDDSPKLVAFPETIGLPLLALGDPGLAQGKTFGAVPGFLRRHWRVVARQWLRGARGLEALYLARAVPAFLAYREAFAAAALESGATIVAGTAFLPHLEDEAARGLHVVGRRVYNCAFTFAPSGALLGRTLKIYLNPGLESRAGLSRGRLEDLLPLDTPAGRIGVAICLDGFYSSVIERLDGLGARVVIQPSANHAAWDRPWPPDPALSEGEAWLERGLRAMIQGRESLRYGINPMMVGDVLGLAPRGRSSIVANLRFAPAACAEGRPGLLALARTADREEVVRAVVELDRGRVES